MGIRLKLPGNYASTEHLVTDRAGIGCDIKALRVSRRRPPASAPFVCDWTEESGNEVTGRGRLNTVCDRRRALISMQ